MDQELQNSPPDYTKLLLTVSGVLIIVIASLGGYYLYTAGRLGNFGIKETSNTQTVIAPVPSPASHRNEIENCDVSKDANSIVEGRRSIINIDKSTTIVVEYRGKVLGIDTSKETIEIESLDKAQKHTFKVSNKEKYVYYQATNSYGTLADLKVGEVVSLYSECPFEDTTTPFTIARIVIKK